MEWTVAAKIILSALLVAAAVVDLKTRRVPHLITWPLLLVAVAVKTWEGCWILPLLLLGLILIGVLPQVWRNSAVVLLVGGVQWWSQVWNDSSVVPFIALWWGVVYVLWLLHVLGGGDVRLFMALVAFFPRPTMVAALWGGLLFVGAIWLLVQHRRNALAPLLQAGQDLADGRYPSQEDLEEQGRPMTLGLVLGALAHLWLVSLAS